MTTEIKAETSKVLMSDVLRGRVTEEIEDEATLAAADALERSVVSVVANMQAGQGKSTAVCGILRSVLFETEPELEFRVPLDDALNVIEAENLKLLGFELHHGDRTVKIPGPFLIKGARIDDIDALNSLCILMLGLKRPPKT